MTIQKLNLILILICFNRVEVMAQKTITIIGTALDAKPNAIVDSKSKGVYYLDGLSHWDKKYYGKKVRVTGFLVIDSTIVVKNDTIRKIEKDGLPLPPKQGTDAPIRVIRNAKWSLTK